MIFTGDGFKIWILAGSGSLIGNLYCGVKVRGHHTLQYFECCCGISFGHRFSFCFFKESNFLRKWIGKCICDYCNREVSARRKPWLFTAIIGLGLNNHGATSQHFILMVTSSVRKQFPAHMLLGGFVSLLILSSPCKVITWSQICRYCWQPGRAQQNAS